METLSEQGDYRAQFNLGLMYYNGQGVLQDDKTALKGCTLTAEQGSYRAQFNLTPQFDFNGDGRIDTADGVVVGGSTIGYAARKVEGKGLLTAPSVSGNVHFAPSSGVKKTEDMTKTALVDSDANNSGRISWEELTPREVTAPTTPVVTTDTETATATATATPTTKTATPSTDTDTNTTTPTTGTAGPPPDTTSASD